MLPDLLFAEPGVWPSRRRRSRAAATRLESARRGFEGSLADLRKAALDHIDSQDLMNLTLRLWLDPCPSRVDDAGA